MIANKIPAFKQTLKLNNLNSSIFSLKTENRQKAKLLWLENTPQLEAQPRDTPYDGATKEDDLVQIDAFLTAVAIRQKESKERAASHANKTLGFQID